MRSRNKSGGMSLPTRKASTRIGVLDTPASTPEVVPSNQSYLRCMSRHSIWHVCEKFGVTKSWVRGTLGRTEYKAVLEASGGNPLSQIQVLRVSARGALRVKAQTTPARQNCSFDEEKPCPTYWSNSQRFANVFASVQ